MKITILDGRDINVFHFLRAMDVLQLMFLQKLKNVVETFGKEISKLHCFGISL